MTTLNTTPQNHEQLNKQPCLFAVHGNSRETRRKRIEAVAELEPSIAFLAAVFDFEWMVRRAILALSESPTAVIKVWFREKHGLKEYKTGWNQFVKTLNGRTIPGLPFLLRSYDTTKHVEWSELKDAFEQRHPLVHGINGFMEDSVATYNMQLFLTASDIIELILKDSGKSAFDTIKPRRAKTDDDVSARKVVAQNRKVSENRHFRVAKRVAKQKGQTTKCIDD